MVEKRLCHFFQHNLLYENGEIYMDIPTRISDMERETLITKLIDELPVLRLKTGLSQDDLAGLLDISRQTYSSMETKKRKMSWSLYLSLILIFYHND